MISHMKVLLPMPCPSLDMAWQGRRTLREVKRNFKRRALINNESIEGIESL